MMILMILMIMVMMNDNNKEEEQRLLMEMSRLLLGSATIPYPYLDKAMFLRTLNKNCITDKLIDDYYYDKQKEDKDDKDDTDEEE